MLPWYGMDYPLTSVPLPEIASVVPVPGFMKSPVMFHIIVFPVLVVGIVLVGFCVGWGVGRLSIAKGILCA